MSHRYLNPYKLSLLQRSFLTPYFGVQAVLSPERGDLVAALGDVSAERAVGHLHKKLIVSDSGKKLLAEKPLITEESLNLSKLRSLSDSTFGKQYTLFMDQHKFSPNDRSKVNFMTDEELAYVLVRYRQVHDFWHVLAGLPPTILGEIGLKAFEYQTTGLPVCLMSTLFGQVRLSSEDRYKLVTEYIPWAVRSAKKCEDLLAYRYEDNLEKDLTTVRNELNFEPAPR